MVPMGTRPVAGLGCQDPVERISEAKASDPRRQRTSETFHIWWERHGAHPVFIKELHEDVRAVIDPQGRGRQFLTSAIRKMEGTRAAGFMLTCQRPAGKWGTATYSLSKTTEPKSSDGCQEHRDHRGHRAEGQPLDNPDDPYAPCADNNPSRKRQAAEAPPSKFSLAVC